MLEEKLAALPDFYSLILRAFFDFITVAIQCTVCPVLIPKLCVQANSYAQAWYYVTGWNYHILSLIQIFQGTILTDRHDRLPKKHPRLCINKLILPIVAEGKHCYIMYVRTTAVFAGCLAGEDLHEVPVMS